MAQGVVSCGYVWNPNGVLWSRIILCKCFDTLMAPLCCVPLCCVQHVCVCPTWYGCVQVELPGVGTFLRSKGGRVRFAFTPDLLAAIEDASMPWSLKPSSDGAFDMRGSLAAADVSPEPNTPLLDLHGPDTPRTLGLQQLHKLCAAADPEGSGYVQRLHLVRWMNRECRALVSQLSAATVLDLLQASTFGVLLNHAPEGVEWMCLCCDSLLALLSCRCLSG